MDALTCKKEDQIRKTYIAAVSGVKNSGKTTFLEKVLKELQRRGYLVAVIKHDGHDFEPDVEGTDTWRLRKAGAYGTAIFSDNRWMMIKEQKDMDVSEIIKEFSDADFILLEGFKYSDYPKFEIVRKGNSDKSVCNPKCMLALVTDMDIEIKNLISIGLEDYEKAADILEQNRNLIL